MRLPPPLDARELKSRVDLATFAVQFATLRRSGRQLVGLCPLHSERHPSFYIHPEKQIFYCFGCGAGGDLFAFVMRVTGCDFRGALQTVAEFSNGVARDNEPPSGSGFCGNEGAEPLSPPKAGAPRSPRTQWSCGRILDALDPTDPRTC